MIFRIATKGGKLLITTDAGKAKKAILEGGKKASEKFIERIKNKKEYVRKLKQRFQARKRKEGDPVYKKKAAERRRRGLVFNNIDLKSMTDMKTFKKLYGKSVEAGHLQNKMDINPRVAGQINPKGKGAIKGMPSQKKFKGGLLVKPKLAKGGY